ncbi:roadblock/LC7 domain-containing protein [Streptomyces sp. NBC_01275]|uniref:roadblock/LC7 domain-containing protein n=1 Tax=Streptomyces sp. NBC_01275 TaxID=2903807 RepID=UPI002252C9CB|nr:roadblock/LC7 domain-containing protein [Streptomyces sp. NBC_01275]MCX4767140.1 roadblock/LC7 domain-containing protein [Streptomyces sp. NBC_01275]
MSEIQQPEPLVEVLTALREGVMGVNETVISTVDGLLVAADVDAVHPESIAALSAATHSLALRMAHEAGGTGLREVATRSADRHVVVQAINARALLTVLGDDGLDLARLQRDIHTTIEQLAKILESDSPS